jgi:hypothetical protein
MEPKLRPIEPVAIVTTDGEERKLLLTFGAMKRVKTRLGCDSFHEALQKDMLEAAGAIVYESLVDKGSLTADQFYDILPMDPDGLGDVVSSLMNKHTPDTDPNLPAPPSTS